MQLGMAQYLWSMHKDKGPGHEDRMDVSLPFLLLVVVDTSTEKGTLSTHPCFCGRCRPPTKRVRARTPTHPHSHTHWERNERGKGCK